MDNTLNAGLGLDNTFLGKNSEYLLVSMLELKLTFTVAAVPDGESVADCHIVITI
jgi:hypothetical protein